MAGRVLNRRELRKQADAAEQVETTEVGAEADAAEEAKDEGGEEEKPARKRVRAKAPAKPRVKKSRKKEPPRMRARWGVFDGGMKQVAIFDYNQRTEADQKAADLSAKKGGVFFLQIVKEAMPDAVPAEAPPA
jgi:hypothetical protein